MLAILGVRHREPAGPAVRASSRRQIPEQGDPVDYVLNHGYIGYALLAVAALLIVLVIGFYLSWRMHTFRITEEVVEVRSGILFRTHRKARLDRIQGINIVRPFFARLFGAAKLEISQAGQDANVQLSYLGSGSADELRREILRLASGTPRRRLRRPGPCRSGRRTLDRRVEEFFAPELDPELAPPESVVSLNVGRLAGSLVLSGGTVFLVLWSSAVWSGLRRREASTPCSSPCPASSASAAIT